MQTKSCKNCSIQFSIAPEDEAFYSKMKVPSPTLCPACREQRRMTWRNERTLYNRTCDMCGQDIIAVIPQKTEYKVYCNACWWKDTWDPLSYGIEPNFDEPFFKQFSRLEKSVPHLALHQDGTSENCKYTNYGIASKNCYMTLPSYCEDVYYGGANLSCKSCADCMKCQGCELCYECTDCTLCYNLDFSKDCSNCRDSQFLEDCASCNDCFCCANLRHKQFVFENKQLSEKEYKEQIHSIKLTQESIQKLQKNLDDISVKLPKIYMHGQNNENITGDYLDHCKNCKRCFDCPTLEDSAYCSFSGGNARNLYDCMNTGLNSELCYECNGATFYNNCIAVYYGRSNHDCEYCQYCFNCDHLFGCVGLRHKNYCIFNHQYTKEEYATLRAKLIEHMRKTTEYGGFFPMEISPYKYEETLAQDYFPREIDSNKLST